MIGVPRAFTPEEPDRIRERLLSAGRELFARRGLRGTSVEELARAAAISKGAFYRFFDSKESLLLVLLDRSEIQMQQEILTAVRARPERGLELLVDAAVRAVAREPLILVAMSEEGLRLVRSRPPEEQRELVERDVRLVERVLGALREAGTPLDVPTDVLLGLLRSLVLIGTHREEIGPELVDAVARWVTDRLRTALPQPGPVAP